jgi:uncharacterized membrane protein
VDTHLLAVAYRDKETAERALAAVQSLGREGGLALKDAAIAYRAASGKVQLDQTRQPATGDGLVGGGSVGLLIGLLVGIPVAGAIAGMAGGGGLAAFDRGIPDDRMRRVAEELDAGQAALFALASKIDWQRVRETLDPLGGELLAAQLDDVAIGGLGAAPSP